MKTDNELIAEFMGWMCRPADKDIMWLGNNEQKVSRLAYHSSWDWLMPVVEKIKHLPDNDSAEHMTEVAKIASALCTVKIWALYKAVVEFIKWYNSQKKES